MTPDKAQTIITPACKLNKEIGGHIMTEQTKSKSPNPAERSQEDFVTLEEARRILDLSKGTLYQYTHYKTIPYYKPNGRKIYFKVKDLINFMERGRRSSIDEIKQQALQDTLKRG